MLDQRTCYADKTVKLYFFLVRKKLSFYKKRYEYNQNKTETKQTKGKKNKGLIPINNTSKPLEEDPTYSKLFPLPKLHLARQCAVPSTFLGMKETCTHIFQINEAQSWSGQTIYQSFAEAQKFPHA